MAGQSITFDFLTTGADRTASGFRKVADNTVLAARGAKVLSNAIETLGQKENRTAAESVLLAKALRQTGDAEDRVAARAVLADAAIRRLDDAMQDSTKHAGGLGKALGGLKLNPGLVGPLLALAPAIATLGGVGAGAATGLGGAFVAGGAALAAFGAVAKPVLSDAKKAADAVQKAEDAHAAAVAKVTGQYQYAMSVAKTKAQKDAAYAAEQKGFSAAGLAQTAAQSKAYAGLSGAQIALSKQLGDMASAWDKVKAAETPVVSGALQPWLRSVTDLTKNLPPVIAKIAPVIASLGGQFDNLVNSSAFKGFRDFVGSTGSAAVSAGGSTIIDLIKSFMILLPKFDPLIREAIGWISRLGPAVLSWASSKKAADQIQGFLQWFSKNGPVVGQFLKSIGGALKALAPGLAAGGAAELQIMTAFFTFIAKLPPGLAKPLAEVAGAMLILQKTGVVSVGIKLTGLAAGATGAGAAAGPFAAAGAAIAGGILLGIRQALARGWHTAIAELPKLLEGVGSILNFSASGWASAILDHFDKPVRQMWDNLGHFLAASFDVTRHQVARAWDLMASDIASAFDIAGQNIRIVWDKIKILFLQGEDFIVRTMGKLPGPLGAPFRAAHASIRASLAQIQGDVASATAHIQADWDRIHGKTVRVNFVGSGSGQIAFKQSIPGVTTGPSSQGILGFHAAGGLIRMGTGPVADDVPAMLSKGELVVPARMVSAGAVDHLRGRLPGFAAGGAVTGMGASDRIPAAGVPFMANAEAAFGRAVEGAFARAVIAKFKKDAANAFTASQVPNVGSGVARWKGVVDQALRMEGLSTAFDSRVLYQMQTESGGNPNAINLTDINAQRGDPSRGLMQVIGSTFRAYHWPGTSGNIYDPLANIAAAINYARHVYGPQLGNQYGGIGSGHGYALGGLVPGFASGGVAGQGAAWLKAWRTRHGGGYGAAWGPVPVNQQIPEMAAAMHRAQVLSGAAGLSPGQHRFWAAAAADEKRRLGVLGKELVTERAWRTQLGINELGLDKQIRAAGNLPSLAGPARGWKAMLARDKATVAGISKMLGYSDAYLAAHKPPVTGVQATHSYGGDVANNLGVVLAAALGPFTGAARGGMVMDSGGWLRPGFNPVWNKTGRPEHLVPSGGRGGGVHLHLTVNGPVGSQQQLEDWYVRTANKMAQHGRLSHAVKTANR